MREAAGCIEYGVYGALATCDPCAHRGHCGCFRSKPVFILGNEL